MNTILKRFNEFNANLHDFLKKDLWGLDFSSLPRIRAILYHQVKLSYIVIRTFIQDRLLVRASALVYATLLSIVPLLAVMFSLLKGFGFHNKLESFLTGVFEPLGEQAQQVIIPNIVEFVGNVNVGALGTAGLILLLVSVLSIINNIERAFNDVWKIKKVRSFRRRFSDYISVLLIGPVLLFAILGLTASLQSSAFFQFISQNSALRFIIKQSAPLFTTWLAFYFLLTFVPNTKIKIKSGLKGSILAGSLWQVANWFFAHFIVTSYQTGAKAALYASFATLPLFLIWLYISWAIVLLGAEISYADQNIQTLTWEEKEHKYSQRYKEELMLKTLLICGRKYYLGERAPSSSELANGLLLPERLINELISDLNDLKLIAIIDGDAESYIPAKSMENMFIFDVIDKIRSQGINGNSNENKQPYFQQVASMQENMQKAVSGSLEDKTIKDLILDSLKEAKNEDDNSKDKKNV